MPAWINRGSAQFRSIRVRVQLKDVDTFGTDRSYDEPALDSQGRHTQETGTMTPDIADTRRILVQLKQRGLAFFSDIEKLDNGPFFSRISEADYFWSKLDDKTRQTSIKLQSDLLNAIKAIANCISKSALLTEADRRDLGTWAKSVRASLRLRKYYTWDAELLHDEGTILGIQQAGQSETEPVRPMDARGNFERDISNLLSLVDLIRISPPLSTDQLRLNPQATANYEPDSAFVMMHIDPKNPELEDRYNTIKDCFTQFGITAVRADEIEHNDVITEKITERIRISEFLVADLTGERPSVYYEIGYAHALSRKVIMYRYSGSKLHFDLAAYNCPEYSNLTELRRKLMSRIEQMTNRRPRKVET